MSERPMTAERWRVVDTILRRALDCAPDKRADFVRDACGTDETLRREVVSLLGAHDAMTSGFLEQPAVVERLVDATRSSSRSRMVEWRRCTVRGMCATSARSPSK
jgi:hypothetical protein